jgi:cytoskeletal protein RodZ
MARRIHKKSRSRFSKKALITLIVLVLVSAALFALHAKNIHQAQSRNGSIPTSTVTPSSSNTSNNPSTTDGSASSTPLSNKLPQPSTASTDLKTPFGTFVSNHKPGQNGSPTSEQSVCNTTAGASCDIQFKNSSGVVKTLGSEKADANGSAYWSWDVKGATLAPGEWHVTAIATLNGQTKTSNDPTPLEVQ